MSNKKTLPKEEAAKLNSFIKFLEQQREIQCFLKPVDYKSLGLDDYPSIVSNPMDISTIKKKLKANKYQNTEEALADIQLIWNNCKAYNVFDSQISRQAEVLERIANTYIAENLLKVSPSKRLSEDSIEAAESPVISYQDKIELSEKVRRVSHEVLTQIVQLIQSECKNSIEKLDPERLLIRVGSLDRTTFNKISELANSQPRSEEPRSSPIKKPKKS